MKTFSQITVPAASAIADLKSIEVQIGLVWYPLTAIKQLFNNVLITFDSFSAPNNTYNLWLDYSGKIQSIRYLPTAGVLTTSVRDVLSDDIEDILSISKSLVSVPSFEAGLMYLIPYTADAVTTVFPPILPSYIRDTTDGLLLETHWVYRSASEMDTRNGSTFQGYTITLNVKKLDNYAAVKVMRKSQEDANFLINSAN